MSKYNLLSQHLWRVRSNASLVFIRKIYCSSAISSNFSRKPLQHVLHSAYIPWRPFSDVPSSKYKVATSLKTHSCDCLRVEDVGQRVVLRGFVAYLRHDKFVLLRDSHGITQILTEDTSKQQQQELTLESYVEVLGTVRRRPSGQENMALSTGQLEVAAERLTVLSRAPAMLPFLVRPNSMPKEELGLRHRHLHLRLPHLQRNLRVRSQVMKRMSDFLEDEAGFVNVTTPTLGPPTSGGAQLFMVPYSGKAAPSGPGGTPAGKEFYCLSQSPQTYKQLLMVAGLQRYYQMALCYRDETSRPDRQPEFMQLDLEMCDVTAEDILGLVERLVQRCWPDERYRDTAGPPPSAPFPRITYADALDRYGSDKPDTRFGWELFDVSAVLRSEGCTAHRLTDTLHQPHCSARAFVVPQGQEHLPKSVQRTWDELARKNHQLPGVSVLGVRRPDSPTSPQKGRPNTVVTGALSRHLSEAVSRELVARLGARPGDAVVLAAGHTPDVLALLGRLRLLAADALQASGVPVRDKTCRQFLWVVDFPLFERSKEEGSLQSVHHAFTAPHPDDIHLLHSHPLQVRSQHYDLVCDGWEVGGGSVRIHDAGLQQEVLRLLRLPPADLAYFTDALAVGAPPHAGIALGVERLTALLCGAPSIRDVTAFPKSGEGRCLLTRAPAPLPAS